jgi:hypothetical protein
MQISDLDLHTLSNRMPDTALLNPRAFFNLIVNFSSQYRYESGVSSCQFNTSTNLK